MLEPVSVGLKLGFLAVLYLFLLWVVRSALKDLRRAARARGRGAPRPSTRPACTARPAGRRRGSRREPRLVVESVPGPRPRHGVRRRATARRSGAATSRSSSRTRSPPRATRGSCARAPIVVIEDLGSTNGTYLNEELLDGPQPLHPRRPHPHRRQRVHLSRTTDAARRRTLRASDTGRAAPANEDALLRARAAVRRRRRDGRRAGRRGRLARPPSRPSRPGLPEAGTAEDRLAAVVRRGQRQIHDVARATSGAPGMGTTLTAAYVGERRHRDRPRRRLARLPLPRRRAERLTEDHSLVEEMRAPRPAHRRGGRRAPAALDHHPRARTRARRRGRHPLVAGPRRRRLPALQRRADVDDRRGRRSRRSCARRAALEQAGRALIAAANEARRARQHHRRPVAPRGRRRAAAGAAARAADRGATTLPTQDGAGAPPRSRPRPAASPPADRAAAAGACRAARAGRRRRSRRAAAAARSSRSR